MRSTVLLVSAACLALGACSKSPDNAEAPATSATASQADSAAEGAAPNITADVAPGVAFDFRYAFSLPEPRIASVQEQHAQLCSRIGTSRCRVTGLRFTKERDGAVEAETAFLLDPALALGFARDATQLVEAADGKLATSHVVGEDAGRAIVASDRSADGLRAELARAESELRIPGLGAPARAALVDRISALRDQLRTLASERSDKVDSLATTPVVFDYAVVQPALGAGESISQGLAMAASSTLALVSLIALALGAVGPWALVGAAVWYAIRRLRRGKSAPVNATIATAE